MDEYERPPPRRGFKQRMSDAAGALLRAAASAGELLSDPSLRRRGAALVIDEASKSIQGLQRGLEEGANTVVEMGVKRVQSVLRDIERKVSDFQRLQSMRDQFMEINYFKRHHVDIQIGGQVYEDMPQEMRSRLYYVISDRRDLADALRAQCLLCGASDEAAGRPRHVTREQQPGLGAGQQEASAAGAAHQQQQRQESGSGDAGDSGGPQSNEQQQQQEGTSGQQHEGAATALAVQGSGSSADMGKQAGTQACSSGLGASAAAGAGAVAPELAAAVPGTSAPSLTMAAVQTMPSMSASTDAGGGSPSFAAGSGTGPGPWGCFQCTLQPGIKPVAPDPWSVNSQLGTSEPEGELCSGEYSNDEDEDGLEEDEENDRGSGKVSMHAPSGAGPLHQQQQQHQQQDRQQQQRWQQQASGQGQRQGQAQGLDDWELLSRDAVGGAVGDSGAVEAVETLRMLAQSLTDCAPLDPARASQAALFEAMLEVPWVQGRGIPNRVQEGGEYARLVATAPGSAMQRCMGGVEPIDDVIARDLGRTFPEHPLFVSGDGQAQLGRLLRTYALHDEEVGYCQGQAFAAGMLLMYVPEEVAFKLYCRLLDDPPAGAGLRRLYQPGLDPLKLELSRFELLVASHMPALHAHLQAVGLPAVLYASQWFMTLFASPFPLHFGGRILDVLLQSLSNTVLPRVALALLEALQVELMAVDDFESIITCVKVTPLQWPVHVYRQILDRALSQTFLSDKELEAARLAAAHEMARLGRPSSFTTRRLLRTYTEGGTERVELSPLAEADSSEGGSTVQQQQQQPPQQRAGAVTEGGSSGVKAGGQVVVDSSLTGAASAGSSAPSGAAAMGSFADLSELDVEFEGLLHDLHLILPGSSSSSSEDEDGDPHGGADIDAHGQPARLHAERSPQQRHPSRLRRVLPRQE